MVIVCFRYLSSERSFTRGTLFPLSVSESDLEVDKFLLAADDDEEDDDEDDDEEEAAAEPP